MSKGSCVCGDFTYEYEGQPGGVIICHCVPCRKTAGSNGSFNVLIPNDKFKKLSGKDLRYTRKGDSGKDVTYNNCATCGTVMFVEAQSMPNVKIVKGGTVNDPAVDEANKPGMEIYTKNRPAWCTAWPIQQAEGGS